MSCDDESVLLPRNIMCSVACASPSIRLVVRTDLVVQHRGHDRRERVVHDDDLQPVGKRGAGHVDAGAPRNCAGAHKDGQGHRNRGGDDSA